MSSEGKDWRLRVLHIRDEIANIRAFTEDMTGAQVAADRKTVYAVVRSFLIIGEAAKKVPDDIRTAYPQIPWKKMAGLRDILVHDYDGVDIDAIVAVLDHELTALEDEILKIPLPEEL